MPNITGTCDCFEVKRLLRSGLKLAAPAFMIPAAKPEIQRRSAMVVDLSEGKRLSAEYPSAGGAGASSFTAN
jgi:hypothetical protein